MAANKRRSAVVVAGFAVVAAAVAGLLVTLVVDATVGLATAVAVAVVLTALAYRTSDAVALATSHARPADPVEHARLHNLVDGLCITAGLPKPALNVIDDDGANALALGRGPRHASLAVTTGMLTSLNRIELEAVLAHELTHVKSYDILPSTVAVTTVGAVALLADWALRFVRWGGPRHRDDQRGGRSGLAAVMAVPGFALLAVAPLAARLMQVVVSRRRELLADLDAVSLTRYPPGLISALEKLRDHGTVVHSGSPATAHLWIETPLPRAGPDGRLSWLGRLFDTHPPLEERIQALREL